jgi:uncharacterized protein (DUF952 family)
LKMRVQGIPKLSKRKVQPAATAAGSDRSNAYQIMLIYHIVLPEVWDEVRNKPFYEADSLETEGFIHCSYADQLDAVIERYYAEAAKIVVLSIDADKLTSTLVSEPSTGGEPYPHIYGAINTDAIVGVEERTVEI